MLEKKTLTDWTICGRRIGQATGWDQPDNYAIQLYDFRGGYGYVGPVGDHICIYFDRGVIETYDAEGDVAVSRDLISAIKDCPIDRID